MASRSVCLSFDPCSFFLFFDLILFLNCVVFVVFSNQGVVDRAITTRPRGGTSASVAGSLSSATTSSCCTSHHSSSYSCSSFFPASASLSLPTTSSTVHQPTSNSLQSSSSSVVLSSSSSSSLSAIALGLRDSPCLAMMSDGREKEILEFI